MPTYNLNELPPEARQKIQQAMEKLKANKSFFGMIGALGELAKTSKELGGAVLINKDQKGQLADFLARTSNGSHPQSTANANIIDMPIADSSTAEVSTSAQAPTEVASLNPKSYETLNHQRNFSPTFNPQVKTDNLRRNLFVVGAAIIIGYLIYKYGFNGTLKIDDIVNWLNSL